MRRRTRPLGLPWTSPSGATVALLLGLMAAIPSIGGAEVIPPVNDRAATEPALAEDAPALRLGLIGPDAWRVEWPVVDEELPLHLRVETPAEPSQIELRRNGRLIWAWSADSVTGPAVREEARSDDGLRRFIVSIPPIRLAVGTNDLAATITTTAGVSGTIPIALDHRRQPDTRPVEPMVSAEDAPVRIISGVRDILGPLHIPAGQTLQIAAGSLLRFGPSASLHVEGTLEIAGTEAAPVYLVPTQPSAGWQAISISGEAAGATIAHARIHAATGVADQWAGDHTQPIRGGDNPDADAGRNGGALHITSTTRLVTVNHTAFIGNAARGTTNEHGLGGAIFLENARLLLRDSTLRRNRASTDGGAIYAGVGSTLTVRRCEMTENQAERDGGAVMVLQSEESLIAGTRIEANVSGRNGGGLNLNRDARIAVRGSQILRNRATASGGGLLALGTASAVIANVTIRENIAGALGGGLHVADDAVALVSNSRLIGNEAGVSGGGLTVWDASPMLEDCVVSDNSAARSDGAGGVAIVYSTPGGADGTQAAGRVTPTRLSERNQIDNNRPRDIVVGDLPTTEPSESSTGM